MPRRAPCREDRFCVMLFDARYRASTREGQVRNMPNMWRVHPSAATFGVVPADGTAENVVGLFAVTSV